jgi:hypothetical protein
MAKDLPNIPRMPQPHRVKNVKLARQGRGEMRGEKTHSTKKSGCPLSVLILVLALSAVGYGATWIVKSIITLA